MNLSLIAKKSGASETKVAALLQKLQERAVIDYHAKNNDATLTFNEVREDDRTINRVSKYLDNQNSLKKAQLQSVLHYINEQKTCKSKLILAYFGETQKENCGICSYCITLNKAVSDKKTIASDILQLLKTGNFNSRQIQNITQHSADDVIFALKQFLEDDAIFVKPNNQYSIRS